jgi:NAD-dependent deacetylase
MSAQAPGSIEVPAGTRTFVLTGAGISAESGIQTFRDSNGLWETHRFEDVASPEGWQRDPGLVWRFYSERRAQARSVSPNPAHLALAALEAHLGDDLFLCTQNVDGLHEAAGSRRVLHMHGELGSSRCERAACDRAPFVDQGLYRELAAIPRCACGARIRPHICWFGEVPFGLDEIAAQLARCQLFVTVGTSGVVWPAAGLVGEVRRRQRRGERVRSVYIGPERPDNAEAFDEVRLGKAGEVLPGLFALM